MDIFISYIKRSAEERWNMGVRSSGEISQADILQNSLTHSWS
jgi:hypothetical protein